MSENTSSRFVRLSVMLSALLAVLIVAGVWLYVTTLPQLTYTAARDAAFAGQYDQMQEKLDWLGENAKESEYYEAVLTFANMADYNGDYDVAIELLDQPLETETEAYAAFAESAEELKAIAAYHKAMKLYEEGEYAKAARMAAGVRGYEPAQSLYRLADSAYQATLPTPSPSPTPSPAPQPTAIPAAAPAETPVPTRTPAPSSTPVLRAELLPEGRLAAGFAHTVVLMEDGTVRAFGDNTYGQTEVASWQNVTYVAAGAYHTLGLTADGRVLACGDNTHTQTDTAMFSGVRAIAAGDYASFLLMASGDVISLGYHPYEFLQELSGIQRIWAGSYGLLAETADGMHASHDGLLLNGQFETAAVSRGYAVAADSQGVTAVTTPLIPQWQGVRRLSASENAVLALTEEGQVLAHLFGDAKPCNFTFTQPVLAVSAAPNHYAFLLQDGTLEIRRPDAAAEVHHLLSDD